MSSTFGSDGSNVIAKGDITGQALSLTDADSTTGSSGGGLVHINDFSANASIAPNVGFTVASGATATSQGGTISFDASHDNAPSGGLDGSFDASSGVDPTNGSGGNSITFTANHNLGTGALVTYNANGNPVVGGLQDGRPYNVIVTSPTQIQLGNTFSGVTVDQTNDVLSWGTATHTFQNGDMVYYFDGGSVIGGLTSGHLYKVLVLDSHTIKLVDPGAPAPSVTVSSSAVNSGTDTITAANSFVNNQAITYTAPTPDVLFNTVAVDQTYSGGAFTDTDNDQIFVGRSDGMGGLTDPGFSTGDAVYYTGGSIGGLSSGNVYYVIVVSTYEIRLADSHAHALSNSYISLGPDKGSGGVQVQQKLWRDNNAPIGGLNDGQTYYVKNRTATTFQLSASSGPGGTVDLDTGGRTGGPQTFGVLGVDFTSGGNGKLVIDITAASSGTQQMVGAGGAGVPAPTSGDGVVTAQASGAGGGLVEVGRAHSSASTNVTVTTEVQGGATLNGFNVNLTTHGYTSAHAESDDNGGGLVADPEAGADVAVSMTSSAQVDGGATINAFRNIFVNAYSQLAPSVEASSNSGGLISGAGGSVHANADFTTVATIQGVLNAGNTATVSAHTNTNATAAASGDTGGAFAGAGTTAAANIGRSSALTQVHILGGGQVNGNFVVLLSQVDEQRANAQASASAGAIGAGVTAEGDVDSHGLIEVRLEPGSLVYGNSQIAITSALEGVSLYAVGTANCDCLGGDTNGNVNIFDNTDARISGVAGSVLKTHDLEVVSDSPYPGFGYHAHQDGGWFDVGGVSVNASANFARNIFWESTVYLLYSPNPVLTVNAAGTIVQDVNVGVTDQFSNPYFLGDTLPVGRVIEVGDLVYGGMPIANFNANDLVQFTSDLAGHPVTPPPIGHVWGNNGHFIVQEAWDSVTITNYSSRELDTHLIEVANLAPIEATITITAEDIPGPTNSPPNDVTLPENPPGGVTIEFDLDHIWPATLIVIQNLQPGGIPPSNVILDGTIYNPIGTVLVRNDRGNIFFGSDVIKANGFVMTNRAFFDAPLGSIGSAATCSGAVSFCPPRSPIVLVLVWSQYVDGSGTHERPIVLNAQAGFDISFDITNVLREAYSPPPVFNPVLGPIHAGGNVDIQVFDSLQGDDEANLAWILINLYHPTPGGPVGPLAGSGLYRIHFRPDLPVPPWLEAILVAFGHVYAPIDSIVTFSDVSAGNNIDLCHGATFCSTDSFTTIPFLVYSDVDATLHANMFGWDDGHTMSTENNVGQIDEYTNGNIVDSELNGNLRVGQIFSTGASVGLLSQTMVLDAANDPGSAGSLTGTDVIGQNIVIFSGLGGVVGGVGTPANFLELQVNHSGGTTPGLLTVEDTAAPLTLGVWVTETSGNLWVNTVHTNGNAALTTLAGSILDGRNGGLGDDKPDPTAPGGCCMVPNVVANFIELFAVNGSIGQPGITKGCDNGDGNGPPSTVGIPRCLPQSDFKIDSSHLITANVGMAASNGIYVSETHGALNVVLALTTSGDIRLTVCDRPTTGDDLNLLANGFVLFTEGVVLPIAKGTIWAVTGSVTLRFGDNLTTDPNSQIIAGKTISFVAGYCDCDGVGSVITLGGTIKSAPVIHLVTTVIMGTPYADTFIFNQTTFNGAAAVYGGAGDDTFTVNQLASMDVAGGDSLTLDGQGGSDLYTVNTAGSMSSTQHNYVVDVLDSGAPTDGSNVLVVNGSNSADVFLLRGMAGQEPPPDPDFTNDATTLVPAVQAPTAFVALLHGTETDVLHRARQDVERINYDAGINGRLIVNGLGGNDIFAVDDNSAITTLDGGAGDDTFLIGQAYSSPRGTCNAIGTIGDVTNVGACPPGPPDVDPLDAFPTTDATLGWISRGNSYPIVAYGGAGNDAFLVLANHAALTLDGGAGNDLFAVRASARMNPQTNAVLVDTFLTPIDANGAPSANTVPVYTVDATVDAIAGAGDDALYVIGTGLGDYILQTGAGSLLGAGLHLNPVGFAATNIHIVGTGAPCTGSCANAVVSEDLEGLSAVVDHAEAVVGGNPTISTNLAAVQSVVTLAGGIGLDVASDQAGQVVITESGGSTRVYEQPQSNVIGTNDSVNVIRLSSSIDTFSMSLAAPANAAVYVNVSVALGPLADQSAGDQTVLVSLDGVNWAPYVVLTFAPGDTGPQTVWVKAVDDTGAEGERNATINFSSSSADPRFDDVAIRNVTVDVIDNDTRGIVVTQSGGSTVVLPGAVPQGIADSYQVAPTQAPATGHTATITISFDPALISVTSSDSRYNAATTTATFDSTNWTIPVTFVVTAVAAPGGAGGTTTILNRLGGGGGISASVPVTILPSNAPLVYAVQSNGSTLVTALTPDVYSIRLTAAPAGGTPNSDGFVVGGQIQVLIVTDGQTVPTAADPTDTRWAPTASPNAIIVTFDAKSWYLPFFIQLQDPPGPPVTDPFQPVKSFPLPYALNAPADTWTVAPSLPDLTSIDAPAAGNHRSLDALLCTDVLEQEDNAPGQHLDFSNATGFGCNTTPERQPIILPTERGAGVAPRLSGDLPTIFVEATSRDGAPAAYPATLPVVGDVGAVSLTFTPGPGTVLPLGTSRVSVFAIDQGGNYATFTVTVVVRDTTPPVITAPNLTVEGNARGGAFVTYTATATDAVGPVTLTFSIPPGSLFPVGTTTVTVTATDGAGNSSKKTFTVRVRDTTPPVITSVSQNLVVEATGPSGATVFFNAAAAFDVVGPVTITYSRASGSTFGFGTTTVTVTATDGAGNTARATFTVTVRDTTPPVITSISPNLTVEATSSSGAAVKYIAATAFDAVGPVTITYSKASGSTFKLGTTVVTVTARDGHGNVSTLTFTITIVDTTPPVFTFVSPDIAVSATSAGGAVVRYAAAKATDAVGPVTITYSKASGTVFRIGTTVVTVTATDGAGNTTTSTFRVTVLRAPS